jgi:glycosyltransferase involved in cell wall biosynthesis
MTGAQALADTRGIPSLVIVHDVGIVDSTTDRAGMNWITRRSVQCSLRGLRHATKIATVSRFTAGRLLAFLPELEERIVTIPNGVDTQFLEYQAPRQAARVAVERQIGRPIDGPLLLYVGSEVPRKNVGVLLQAFRLVRDAFPNAQFLKVGNPGHDRWRALTLQLAAEIGLNVGSDLIFLEDVDDELLIHLYRAADAFVSASRYEGFGLPVLEAMAVGTPVVATNCGAFPEVVGSFGWLTDPDADAIANTVHSVLDDPCREERVAAARSHASLMSWARAADAYLDLLQHL